MPENADSLIGTVLDGRYQLTAFIAEGGMGRVYRAEQRVLNRTVAVKLLKEMPDGGEEFQKRFFLEASLCARLSHPNTIRIFDYGCHGGQVFYIVMEFLEGRSVLELIKASAPLPIEHVIDIASQVCHALIEAHDAGLVHRDLKPSNLFATPDGVGGERIKILDFGVVKQLGDEMEITRVQSVVGSPQYMSPEQIKGEPLDGRSDLYSLGAIMFQLLTGRVPFSGRDPMSVVMKHITEPVPSLVDVHPGLSIPVVIEDLVKRALAKTPDARFRSARQMLDALASAAAVLGGGSLEVWPEHPAEEATLSELPTGVLDATTHIEPEDSFDLTLSQLKGTQLDGYTAYIDLNCPYCYALFERVYRWGLADQIEWCMVEHASHVLDGEFDLAQEELLSSEVFEVHHRAPDIELSLPPDRCQSTQATRLIAIVQRVFPEQTNAVRVSLYRALWREGRNIGDMGVLLDVLRRHDLPAELLGMCEEPPDEFIAWQKAWENGDFDHSIPVMTHAATGRVIIGLADQSSLAQFLLGERMRVIDRTVCFYQPKPALLLCGWLNHLWPLLSEIKDAVEIIQAPTARRAAEMLGERSPPAMLLVQENHVTAEELFRLGQQARSRSVPWLVASLEPDSEREVAALSAGAAEVLPVGTDTRIAQVRLSRILRDRFQLRSEGRMSERDALTGLPTRRAFLTRLEDEWGRAQVHGDPLSLVLLNLDGFKAFNRAHGYVTGDQVLVDLSRQFQREIAGRGQSLARFSGNEFVALLPGASTEDALAVGERLQSLVSSAKVINSAAAAGEHLNASIGVHTEGPADHNSMYVLVDGAHRDLKDRRARA
mgnify:CR=1 FL=1